MSSRTTPLLAIVAIFAVASVVVETSSAAGSSTADPKRSIREQTPRAATSERESFDSTPRPLTTSPIFVRTRRGDVLAYPPGAAAPPDAPIVVYIHGMAGRAENGCPFMRSGPDAGWLVCPEANVKAGKGWSWTRKVKKDARVVQNAIRATRSKAPRVAVGFSQGAYVTLQLLEKAKASFRGIVLLGASVSPKAKTLRARGVERVVLGASKDEPWHDKLEDRAAKLQRAGIDARFVSLGHAGHLYIAEDPEVLREAIAWTSETSG